MIPRQNFTNSLAVSFSLAFTHGIHVTLNTKFKTNKNFSCQIYFRFHYLAQHKVSIRFSMNIMDLNGIFILIVGIYHLRPVGKLSLQLVLCQHYPSSQTNAIHCTKDLHKYSPPWYYFAWHHHEKSHEVIFLELQSKETKSKPAFKYIVFDF